MLQRMQAMHAEAELRRLLQLGKGGLDGDEQVVTLVAVASRDQVAHLPALDAELQLPSVSAGSEWDVPRVKLPTRC